MVLWTQAVDGSIDIAFICISPAIIKNPARFGFPFVLHMGIRSRQCQVIVKLMIYREIERLLIFLGIYRCTYRFLLRFIPNRKGSNGIRHLGDIVMNSQRRLIREFFTYTKCPCIAFFIFQWCFKYAVNRGIIPFTKWTEYLRPSRIHAGGVIKHIFRIDGVVQIMGITFPLCRTGRVFKRTILGVTNSRCKIPFIGQMDFVLNICLQCFSLNIRTIFNTIRNASGIITGFIIGYTSDHVMNTK